MRVERITILQADMHVMLCEANDDGVAHTFSQDEGDDSTVVNLLWNPDADVPTLRVKLKPDGTWQATIDVITGRAEE